MLIHKGNATLRAGSLHGVVRAKVVGGSSIQLIPLSGSATLMQALKAPIQLGPLPDGVQLTGNRPAQGPRDDRRERRGRHDPRLRSSQASSTARESRCWPTLRLTRCRALSTAFGSHSTISPISS